MRVKYLIETKKSYENTSAGWYVPLLNPLEEKVTEDFYAITSGGGSTSIDPFWRKCKQEIAWNYIWWRWGTFIDFFGRKVNQNILRLHLVVGE